MRPGIVEQKSSAPTKRESVPTGSRHTLPKETKIKVPPITGRGSWEEIDVTDFLSMTSDKPLIDITPLEAAECLEKIGRMRYFLWERYLHVRHMRIAAELQFEAWWASKWQSTKSELKVQNISEVTKGNRSKTQVEPTQKDVDAAIITGNTKIWRESKDQVTSLSIKEKEIFGLYTTVDKRGEELRTMIREVGQLLWRS